jgi:hypothetical protein
MIDTLANSDLTLVTRPQKKIVRYLKWKVLHLIRELLEFGAGNYRAAKHHDKAPGWDRIEGDDPEATIGSFYHRERFMNPVCPSPLM